MDPQYARIPGQRRDQTVLVDRVNHHLFHLQAPDRYGCYHLNDEDSRCPASLVGNHERGFTVITPHNDHQNDLILIQQMEMRNWCLARAANQAGRLTDICEEAEQRFPNVRIESRPALIRAMQRARNAGQPTPPHDVEEAHRLLREHLRYSMDITGAQPFYSGHVVDEDGRGALVFVNEAVLGTFVDAEELHIDGTFKTVPLPFYQVVPVLFIRFDKAFVSAWLLMESKSSNLYKLGLQRVKEACQRIVGRLPEPRMVISDYELAILQAAAAVFPTARIRGCWFHSGNAMYMYAVSLNLTISYRNKENVRLVIRMCIALALLPAERIEAGFERIKDLHRRHVEGNDRLPLPQQLSVEDRVGLGQFFEYVQSFWIDIVGPARFSVHNDPRRTNNDSESFNRRLNRKANGEQQNFWQFISILQQMSSSDTRRLEEAARPNFRPRQRRRYRRMDNAVMEMNRELQLGRLSIVEFLIQAAGLFNPLRGQQQGGNLPEEVRNPVEARGAFRALLAPGDPVEAPALHHAEPREEADPLDNDGVSSSESEEENEDHPHVRRGLGGVAGQPREANRRRRQDDEELEDDDFLPPVRRFRPAADQPPPRGGRGRARRGGRVARGGGRRGRRPINGRGGRGGGGRGRARQAARLQGHPPEGAEGPRQDDAQREDVVEVFFDVDGAGSEDDEFDAVLRIDQMVNRNEIEQLEQEWQIRGAAALAALQEEPPPVNECQCCLVEEQEVQLETCRHRFCRRCVERVLQSRPPLCPQCRRQFGRRHAHNLD